MKKALFWLAAILVPVFGGGVYAASAIDGFNPNANGDVYSVAVQPDGKILVGGTFTSIGGQPRNYIARLNPDGTLDTTFNPNADYGLLSIAVQPDGRILVGGEFASIGGQTRNRIARLNPDGTLDTTFNPNADNWVRPFAVQTDGRILVGGWFTNIGGQARNRIARFHPDGTLDTTFNPNANDAVVSIAVQADGRILVGGSFTAIGGQTRNRIARLNPDGTLDTTFDPNANDVFHSITVQQDGKILVGGRFTSIGGQTRNRIARLSMDDAALQELSITSDGSTINWMRSQSSPEVYDVTFLESSDMSNWTLLGQATRISGGWQMTGLSLPFNQNRYVRAQGKTYEGFANAATSLIEAVRQYYNVGYALTVTKAGPGKGTVTSDLGGIDCGYICSASFIPDASVNLFAKAEIGSYFYGWSGDCAACGSDPHCNVTMNSARNCTATFISGGPGEASKSGSPLTATKGSGTAVNVSYTPANCATDHSVYWGQGPILANLSWTNGACGLGTSGTTSFDAGDLSSGSFFYFVIVGNNGTAEGSYGKSSSSVERPEATGIVGCDIPQNLTGACD
jgi:uncharacterized delta-60 repeat protein